MNDKILSNTFVYVMIFALMAFSVSAFTSPSAVNLGTAGNYAVLAETTVTTTGVTAITGDIGISPNGGGSLVGFAQSAPPTTFSTSSLVTGKIYAANYDSPTPAILTTAISDMQTAYTNGSIPTPDVPNINGGNLGGQVLAPGVYAFNGASGNVHISGGDLTLSGGANDVWIFQIAGTLDSSADLTPRHVFLTGGAQAKNVFWIVAGQTTLFPGADFSGIILDQTGVAMQLGATLTGRALAQTAVTLNANTVTLPVGSNSTIVSNSTPTLVNIAFNTNLAANPVLTGSRNFPDGVVGHEPVVGSANLITIYYSDNITNSTLSSNVSGDILTSSGSGTGVVYYSWKPSTVSGERSFIFDNKPLKLNGTLVTQRVISDVDEFFNGISNVVITINQHNSSIQGNIDFTNQTIKLQDLGSIAKKFNISGITGTFDIQDSLLNQVTLDVSFVKGNTHPTYNSVYIYGDSAPKLGYVLNTYFSNEHIKINGTTCTAALIDNGMYSCFDAAIDHVGLNQNYSTSYSMYKNQTYYYVYKDDGYDVYNNNTIKNITDVLNSEIQTINPVNFLNAVSSYINSTGLFTISNITSKAVTLSNSDGTWTIDLPQGNISVDTRQTPLASGNYIVTLNGVDQYGNKASKNITLVLNIATQSSSSVTLNTSDVNGSSNVTFPDTTVSNFVAGIVVPNSINVTNFTMSAQVFGTTLPTIEPVSALDSSNNPMIYIVFSASVNLTNNNFTIYFDVPRATLGSMDPNYVQLFVYENGGWTSLPTSVVNSATDPVQFSAITHHFSTYVIGSTCPSGTHLSGTSCVIDPAPTHSGGGGGGGGYIAPKNVTNTTSTNEPIISTPLNSTNDTTVFDNQQKYTPPVSGNAEDNTSSNATGNNGAGSNGITGQAISNVQGGASPVSIAIAFVAILIVILVGFLVYHNYYRRK